MCLTTARVRPHFFPHTRGRRARTHTRIHMALEAAAVAGGTFLLAAAVGYEGPRGAPTAAGWSLGGASAALAALAAARHVRAAPPRAADGLVAAYVVGGLAASAAAGVATTFAVAYACAVLLLLPLFVAHRAGLVAYDPTPPHFLVSRGALYAALRAAGQWLEARGALAPAPALLLPLAASTAETAAMYALGTRSYAFPVHSRAFAAYALLRPRASSSCCRASTARSPRRRRRPTLTRRARSRASRRAARPARACAPAPASARSRTHTVGPPRGVSKCIKYGDRSSRHSPRASRRPSGVKRMRTRALVRRSSGGPARTATRCARVVGAIGLVRPASGGGGAREGEGRGERGGGGLRPGPLRPTRPIFLLPRRSGAHAPTPTRAAPAMAAPDFRSVLLGAVVVEAAMAAVLRGVRLGPSLRAWYVELGFSAVAMDVASLAVGTWLGVRLAALAGAGGHPVAHAVGAVAVQVAHDALFGLVVLPRLPPSRPVRLFRGYAGEKGARILLDDALLMVAAVAAAHALQAMARDGAAAAAAASLYGALLLLP